MRWLHLDCKNLSRANGSSAKAKYRYNSRIGKYAKPELDKALVVKSGNMPEWARANPAKYWEAADRYERANGRLAQSIEFALPKELTLEQQVKAVEAYLKFLFDKLGHVLPYSYAIHAGRGENPHVHIMLSERINDGVGRDAATWFKRAATKDMSADQGGAVKTVAFQGRKWIDTQREDISKALNKALEAAGHEPAINHKSYAEQELDIIPDRHEGPRLRAMTKAGILTERMEEIERERNLSLLPPEEVQKVLDAAQLAATRPAVALLDDMMPDIRPETDEKPIERDSPMKAKITPLRGESGPKKQIPAKPATASAPPRLSDSEVEEHTRQYMNQYHTVFNPLSGKAGTYTTAMQKAEAWAKRRQSSDPKERRWAVDLYEKVMAMKPREKKIEREHKSRERGGWVR